MTKFELNEPIMPIKVARKSGIISPISKMAQSKITILQDKELMMIINNGMERIVNIRESAILD
jgi:hypothetical protein